MNGSAATHTGFAQWGEPPNELRQLSCAATRLELTVCPGDSPSLAAVKEEELSPSGIFSSRGGRVQGSSLQVQAVRWARPLCELSIKFNCCLLYSPLWRYKGHLGVSSSASRLFECNQSHGNTWGIHLAGPLTSLGCYGTWLVDPLQADANEPTAHAFLPDRPSLLAPSTPWVVPSTPWMRWPSSTISNL